MDKNPSREAMKPIDSSDCCTPPNTQTALAIRDTGVGSAPVVESGDRHNPRSAGGAPPVPSGSAALDGEPGSGVGAGELRNPAATSRTSGEPVEESGRKPVTDEPGSSAVTIAAKTVATLSVIMLLSACWGSKKTAQVAETDPIPPATEVPAEQPSGFVYTANELENSISAINLSTGDVTNIPAPLAPHNVQTSTDGGLLLAVGPAVAELAHQPAMMTGGAGMMKRGRLWILGTDTLTAEAGADIEVGHYPAHVILDAEGGRAYVTNSGDNTLLVIDVAQKRVDGAIKTGAFPHGLRMSPNGEEIYVANFKGGSVSVISVAQSAEVARIQVGAAPVQVAFSPDGARVYVSLQDENRIAIITTGNRTKVGSVPVGRNPVQLAVTPDGRYVYAANQGTEENPDNTVSVIDAATEAVIATIVTGKGAHGVVVSSDGQWVFVSNKVDGTVSVIDTVTQRVIDTIPVGRGPNGIAFQAARR